jgi:large subunit ribosomal protein L15
MPHDLRKTRRQRGSRYCGWGQVGQHRKSGGRGGKGMAGGHKHFWIQTVKYNPLRFRSIGFKPPSVLKIAPATINIGELEDLARKVLGAEATREGGELDLTSMGIGKLLGRGSISIPLKVRVDSYTSSAQEKIKEAGGSIVE